MTDPASVTAGPGIADAGPDTQDKPTRSRAELLALLRNEGYAPQRPYPTPRFFPVSPPPGREDAPDWLRRPEQPAASRESEVRRRRKPATAATRRRKARGAGQGLWLATTAMLGIALIAGTGLFYIAATGRDLPGTAQLDRAGEALAGLWPGASATGKADPAGLVQTTSTQETALAAPGGKPVTTAHLDVADASGQTMQPIPLRLGIAGAPHGRDMAIALYGLPAAARLSAGERQPDGAWLIPAAATSGLRLTMPVPTDGPLTLAAAVRDKTSGTLASPYKEMSLTVTAASAAAKDEAVSDEPAGSGGAVLTQGLEAMLAGDVKAARALLRQAVELGEQRAVAHLGRSYDPLVLARLKSSNAAADREKAIAWYRRAIEAGDASVRSDMAALETQQAN